MICHDEHCGESVPVGAGKVPDLVEQVLQPVEGISVELDRGQEHIAREEYVQAGQVIGRRRIDDQQVVGP